MLNFARNYTIVTILSIVTLQDSVRTQRQVKWIKFRRTLFGIHCCIHTPNLMEISTRTIFQDIAKTFGLFL